MSKPTFPPNYQGEVILTKGAVELVTEYGPDSVYCHVEVYRADLLPHPEGGLRLQWQRYACCCAIEVDNLWRLRDASSIPISEVKPNEADRCRFACPHGDRCTLARGHHGGHNHAGCACNEPDREVP